MIRHALNIAIVLLPLALGGLLAWHAVSLVNIAVGRPLEGLGR